MPMIGGIEVNPEYIPTGVGRAANERPGLGALLASGAQSAYGNLRYGLPYQFEKLVGSATPEDDRYYQAWLQDSAERANATAPGGPANVSDWWSGNVGLGRMVAENLAYSAPRMLGSVAGAIGGGGLGGP